MIIHECNFRIKNNQKYKMIQWNVPPSAACPHTLRYNSDIVLRNDDYCHSLRRNSHRSFRIRHRKNSWLLFTDCVSDFPVYSKVVLNFTALERFILLFADFKLQKDVKTSGTKWKKAKISIMERKELRLLSKPMEMESGLLFARTHGACLLVHVFSK